MGGVGGGVEGWREEGVDDGHNKLSKNIHLHQHVHTHCHHLVFASTTEICFASTRTTE